MAFNRYKFLITPERKMQSVPGIFISKRSTDKYVVYNYDKMRFDTISAEIYGNDLYNWVILLGNPEYPLEFDIPNNTVVRVPFPLDDVLVEYESKIVNNKDK